MTELLFKDETYRIRGACFEVYKEKGSGFLEAVYQECFAIELGMQGIPFVAQQKLALTYKGRPLETQYVPDFICFGLIIIELKAVTELTDTHRAQLHNYVKAADLRLGLLINFGHHPKVEIERYAR